MWHLVGGDAAAEGVTFVLGQTVADDSLRVLRDDLAVGPLADIEQPPCTERAAFWSAVWPEAVQPLPDFSAGLGADACWLAALSRQTRPITVWHGDSACEQLLLARVAAALEHVDLPLWEVPCGRGDSRVSQRRAVSMHAPEALRELNRPRLLEPVRRRQLAGQWRVALLDNALVRRWRDGTFHGEGYGAIDASLLQCCPAEGKPLARVMAEVMAHCDGFFATDYFLFWRARELATAGRIELTGEAGAHGYGGLQARLI
ncbi:DUF1835 domain-containing protein [Pseudomonas sp. CrR25]|nr:DUF1835 domain-containing protein [Pseudomonas sp. CrR25]